VPGFVSAAVPAVPAAFAATPSPPSAFASGTGPAPGRRPFGADCGD
jgi:hypothetical protein